MVIYVCTAIIRVSVRNNNIRTTPALTIYYNMHYIYIISIVIGIIRRQQLLNHYNNMYVSSDGR